MTMSAYSWVNRSRQVLVAHSIRRHHGLELHDVRAERHGAISLRTRRLSWEANDVDFAFYMRARGPWRAGLRCRSAKHHRPVTMGTRRRNRDGQYARLRHLAALRAISRKPPIQIV